MPEPPRLPPPRPADGVSPPARRRTAAAATRLVSLLLLPAALAACAGPAPAPRYEDLVVGQGLASSLPPGGDDGGEGGPAQLACAQETHFARALRPGEVLTAGVELGTSPRLVVSACRRPAADGDPAGGSGATGGAGELVAEVAGAGGGTVEARWPLAGEPGWWRRELDLGALAGEHATVRLEARFEGEPPLLLKELTVEHLTPAPARRGRPPQVLLISVDTLRDDAVGAAADGAPATPALDRLAADGERFEPHYAGATWTKPSHAQLLTGYGAGVHRSFRFEDPIHPRVPTLAERFHAAGFRTAGRVHDCVWLDPKFGFDRGFESYRSEKWDAEPEVREAVDWMVAHRAEPFFFFLHLFDPHSDFHVLPYEGTGVTQYVVQRRFGVPGYGCRAHACASALLGRINDGELEPIPGEGEILRFLYDRGVERTDAALGRLFDDLRAAGLYDGLLIVFTSDHGEAFFEHGKLTHLTWHEEVLRVPLIVKWPEGARAGTVTRRPSSSVDVAATVLAAAGVAADDLPGSDLRRRRADRPVFAGTYRRAVIVGTDKAVFSLGDEPAELYDLAADPGERHDLAAERPGELARLHELFERRRAADARLRERLAATGFPGAATLQPEERERLRALGYLD